LSIILVDEETMEAYQHCEDEGDRQNDPFLPCHR